MRRLVLLVLAVGGLAGPASAVADESGGPTWDVHRLPASGAQYDGAVRPGDGTPVPKVLPPGTERDAHAGEPQVLVADDARVYVNAFGGRAWRSDDGGRTFREMAALGLANPAARHTATTDSDLAVGPAPGGERHGRGLLHAVSQNASDGYYTLRYTRSPAGSVDPNGLAVEAWEQGREPIAPSVDRPNLAVDGPLVLIAYTDSLSPLGRQLLARSSTEHGAPGTFGAPVRVFDGVPVGTQAERLPCFNRHGELAVVPRRGQLPVVHLPYTTAREGCDPEERSEQLDDLHVATSADGGATWSHEAVPRDSVQPLGFVFPSLSANRDGDLYTVWAEGTEEVYTDEGTRAASGRELRLQVRRDGTWLPVPLHVEVPGQVDAVMPTVVASKHGADVLWYSGRACTVGTRSTTCWTAVHAAVRLHDHRPPTVVLQQVSPGDVHAGRICTDGLNCALLTADASEYRFNEFLGLDRGPDGVLHAVFNSTREPGFQVAVLYGRLPSTP